MIKRGFILVLAAFLAAGPFPFQKIHQDGVEQFWHHRAAVIAAVRGRPATPAKRLPAWPAHDASKCAACLAMHLPLVLGHSPASVCGVHNFIGFVPLLSSVRYAKISSFSQHCRGPPLA
ncbi:MAG: hypothetical protein M3O30_09455 [Planctomycetota bacterium]|nr:hypothetical protein [Planctomycetota bacterium]